MMLRVLIELKDSLQGLRTILSRVVFSHVYCEVRCLLRVRWGKGKEGKEEHLR